MEEYSSSFEASSEREQRSHGEAQRRVQRELEVVIEGLRWNHIASVRMGGFTGDQAMEARAKAGQNDTAEADFIAYYFTKWD